MEHKFCVYLTFYSGNKLPPFYIGSTSVRRISEGYHGTVRSIRYGKIWKEELKLNPQHFKTQIVKSYSTRKEALEHEHKLQQCLNVVRSVMYINQAYASPNGSHGRDVRGKNNPMFNKKHSVETRLLQSKVAKGNPKSPESISKRTKTVRDFWGSDSKETAKRRELFRQLNSGENNPMFGKKGENNPNWGRKNTVEGNQNISRSLKGKPKTKEHVKHMSRVYTIEEESTGKIHTGYGLGEFCKNAGMGQGHFLYYFKSNKFFKGYRLLEKNGMCADSSTKSLSELFGLG